MASRFLCGWWHLGKFNRGLRFKKLKSLYKSLETSSCYNRHVYLHLGSVPTDATKEEINRFMKDIQKTLIEKYNLKGDIVELEPR